MLPSHLPRLMAILGASGEKTTIGVSISTFNFIIHFFSSFSQCPLWLLHCLAGQGYYVYPLFQKLVFWMFRRYLIDAVNYILFKCDMYRHKAVVWNRACLAGTVWYITLLDPELFFLVLAHPVYKMWIIQEPNTIELWNKLHFEEENTESIDHV